MERPEVRLTPTEQQVRDLVKEGYTPKEIAYILKRSTKTIAEHISSLQEKYGIYDRTKLVIYLRDGIQVNPVYATKKS